MVVATIEAEVVLQGNGVAKSFPLGIKLLDKTDVWVWTRNNITGTMVQLTLDSDYSVLNLDVEEGATITYPISGDALASGYSLVVQRRVPLTSSTDFSQTGAMYPSSIEDAIDRLAMGLQQLEEKVNRAIRLGIGSATEDLSAIPSLAGKVLQFGSNGQPEAGPDSAAIAEAGTNATAAESAAQRAEAAASNLILHKDSVDAALTSNLTSLETGDVIAIRDEPVILQVVTDFEDIVADDGTKLKVYNSPSDVWSMLEQKVDAVDGSIRRRWLKPLASRSVMGNILDRQFRPQAVSLADLAGEIGAFGEVSGAPIKIAYGEETGNGDKDFGITFATAPLAIFLSPQASGSPSAVPTSGSETTQFTVSNAASLTYYWLAIGY